MDTSQPAMSQNKPSNYENLTVEEAQKIGEHLIFQGDENFAPPEETIDPIGPKMHVCDGNGFIY